MISLTQDSELVKNLLPASPIVAKCPFKAIKDQDSKPALLALGEDKKLNLIIFENGHAKLFDYGKLCGLQGDVLAFDVYQDTKLNLWLAVATSKGNKQSDLHLLADIAAKAILSPPKGSIFKSDQSFGEIHHLYMSNFILKVGTYQLPKIFLAFQPTDKITGESQLGYLDVAVTSNNQLQVKMNTSWKLATNPERIIDVAFGCSVGFGHGAFVLYEGDRKLYLQFRDFSGHDFSAELEVPQGANCLTSYVDTASGDSVLIVGGSHLTSYTFKEYTAPNGKGTKITANNEDLGVKSLHSSQIDKNFTLWFTTSNDAVSYYSASISDPTKGLLVPLLPSGEGAQISSLLSATSSQEDELVNTLLSTDKNGTVKALQQSTHSGMWEVLPFFKFSSTNNIEVLSFTIRIAVVADASSKENTADCELLLRASSQTQTIANGLSLVLSKSGTWVKCDSHGVLTLVVAASDLACVNLKANSFKSRKGVQTNIAEVKIDPTEKTRQKLQSSISNGSDLLKAKTQNGRQLVPDGLSQHDADQAANAIWNLSRQKLPDSITIDRERIHQDLAGGKLKIVHVAGILPNDPETRASYFATDFLSDSWDFFHNLYEHAKDVLSWGITKIGQGINELYQLAITWAGKTYRFLLDTIQAIGKAISWIFNKIKVGIEMLCEYIGFLFSWNDILKTSDSINAYLDSGLAYGQSQVGPLKSAVTDYVNLIKDNVTKKKTKPNNIKTNEKDPRSNEKMENVKHGVAFNFASYHVQHSGFAENSIISSQSTMAQLGSSDTDLHDIWKSITKEVEVAKSLVDGITNDIKDLFDPNTSTDKIFDRLKDQMIKAALDTLQNIATAVLSAIDLAISGFKELGRFKIQVPIFSALWTLIAPGREFNIFNCLSLILAIPTTILYKLAKSRAPPELKDRINKASFGQYVTGGKSVSDPHLTQDISSLSQSMAVGAGALSTVVTVISFVTDHGQFYAADNKVEDEEEELSAIKEKGKLEGGTMFLDTSPELGNAIDGATIFFDVIGLIASWPLKHKHDPDLRWAVWGLDLSNAIFLASSRLVGWKFHMPRVETKRFVGIYQVVTSIPIYVMQLIVDVHELALPDSDSEKNDSLTTRHIIEESADLVESWAFGVAALSDGKNEEVTFVALGVMGFAMGVKVSLKFVDFCITTPGFYSGPDPVVVPPPVSYGRLEE